MRREFSPTPPRTGWRQPRPEQWRYSGSTENLPRSTARQVTESVRPRDAAPPGCGRGSGPRCRTARGCLSKEHDAQVHFQLGAARAVLLAGTISRALCGTCDGRTLPRPGPTVMNHGGAVFGQPPRAHQDSALVGGLRTPDE